MMQPYNAPATFWNQWGPLYARAFGLPRLESVGYNGCGTDKVLEVMEKAKVGRCPFSTFGMV